MTPREIEKTIDFILRSQAAAEVRQDRTDAQIAELVEQNKTMSREMRESDRRLTAKLAGVGERVDNLAESIAGLREACRDLMDHARWAEARIRRLESEG